MNIKENGTDAMISKGYTWVFIPTAGNGLMCNKIPLSRIPVCLAQEDGSCNVKGFSLNQEADILAAISTIVSRAEGKG